MLFRTTIEAMLRAAFALIWAALLCSAQNTNSAPKGRSSGPPLRSTPAAALNTTAQIAKRVAPSVVVIQGNTDSGDVLGSGFIVSKDGKIVTSLHVIRDMKTASVQLANGKMFDLVSVLGTDERRDLAVVKIAGLDLPVPELGNSDALTAGELLVIVGSPRGVEGAVTAGILSSVRNSGDGFKLLQTDAAVNPGNSGGPLVNSKGQAIGVVSFQLRSAEGQNSAVPINYVRGLLNNLHEPITLEQMRKTLAPTAATLTGKVFAITKGGDLKPARMATLFVLSGDVAAQFKSKMLSEISKAAEAEEAASRLVDPVLRTDVEVLELLEGIKRMDCEKAFRNTLEDGINLAKRNADSVFILETDEEGLFKVAGLKPGSYTVVIIGRAGANDGVWVEDVTLEAGQETPIKMHALRMACPDR